MALSGNPWQPSPSSASPEGRGSQHLRFGIPLPPGVGAALPAAKPTGYSRGASPPAAGDGQGACPQRRMLRGVPTSPHRRPPPPGAAARRGAGQAVEGRAARRCRSVTLVARALAPTCDPLGHGIRILSTAGTEKPPGTAAGCQRAPLRHRGALPPGVQQSWGGDDTRPGGTQPQRAWRGGRGAGSPARRSPSRRRHERRRRSTVRQPQRAAV